MPRNENRDRSAALPSLVAGILGAILVTSCTLSAELVAPDGSHRLVARDDTTGVTVVLTTEAWEGERFVNTEMTAVHVLISNLSSQAILLAPGDFELVDRRGFVYELRDTGARFRREGTSDMGYDPGQNMSFSGVAGGELARNALPWGVLEPGTQMRGFVYFEGLVDRANAAELIWHAQSPAHMPVADFSFPLAVSRGPAPGS